MHHDSLLQITGTLQDVTAYIKDNIQQAYTAGWHHPSDIQDRLFSTPRPSWEDPEEWLNKLAERFYEEVTFPEGWTMLEKAMLFGRLLFDYQRKEMLERNK